MLPYPSAVWLRIHVMGLILKPSVFPQLVFSFHLDSRGLSSYSPWAWGWEILSLCCSLQLKSKSDCKHLPVNLPFQVEMGLAGLAMEKDQRSSNGTELRGCSWMLRLDPCNRADPKQFRNVWSVLTSH